VDFWAQHKDFVLKILAGLGVFLVALIARSITYGDELEMAMAGNRGLAGKMSRMKIANQAEIRGLEQNRTALEANTNTILGQIGWNSSDAGLAGDLVRRILGYTRTYERGPVLDAAAERDLEAIRANLDGGFGQLRLKVRDDLVEEASERNITLAEGLGFQSVTQLDDGELIKYLMQLELSARLARYCIDAGVLAIDEMRIQTKSRESIPDANPEFLEEYTVTIAFRTSQPALIQILNRLEERDDKRVPWRELKITRLPRPADHLGVELTVLALAANPAVPFEKGE
jgi:hypothetical protein